MEVLLVVAEAVDHNVVLQSSSLMDERIWKASSSILWDSGRWQMIQKNVVTSNKIDSQISSSYFLTGTQTAMCSNGKSLVFMEETAFFVSVIERCKILRWNWNILWVIGNNLYRCNNLRKLNSRSWFSSLIERRRRRVCSKSCCIVLGMLGKCRFCSKSYNFIILGSQLSKAINRKMIQSSEINGKWNNVEGKGLYNVNWIIHRHHHLNLALN